MVVMGWRGNLEVARPLLIAETDLSVVCRMMMGGRPFRGGGLVGAERDGGFVVLSKDSCHKVMDEGVESLSGSIIIKRFKVGATWGNVHASERLCSHSRTAKRGISVTANWKQACQLRLKKSRLLGK